VSLTAVDPAAVPAHSMTVILTKVFRKVFSSSFFSVYPRIKLSQIKLLNVIAAKAAIQSRAAEIVERWFAAMTGRDDKF
jgi:hypothetical protein